MWVKIEKYCRGVTVRKKKVGDDDDEDISTSSFLTLTHCRALCTPFYGSIYRFTYGEVIYFHGFKQREVGN